VTPAATVYMGALGTQCGENELILYVHACEQALQQLGTFATAVAWEGHHAYIPMGCSYRPGTDTCDHPSCAKRSHWPHFNHRSHGGQGRGDLQPVCYVSSTSTRAPNAAPTHLL
jgi:hypothetical protein